MNDPLRTVGKLVRAVVLSSALLLVVGAALEPSSAQAGEYTVHTCRFPDGSEAGTGAWRVTESPSSSLLSSWETCPEGGYQLGMSSKQPHPPSHAVRTTFSAPPGTEISAYSFWRSTTLAPYYNYRYYEIVGGGDYLVRDKCYSNCSRKGSWDAHVSPENLVSSSDLEGVRGLEFMIDCGIAEGSTETCPAEWPAARFALHRADVTLRDGTDPVILNVTGPLVDPSTPELSGKVPVSITATDEGGGVYQAVFQVDGKQRGAATIDTNGGACAAPFTQALPCRTSASGTVRFNSRSVSDGAHQLTILVTDASGNTATWGPIPIRTGNGRCNPNPDSRALRMRAHFAGGGHGGTIRTRYAKRARVRGRLTTRSGDPMPNAPICISSRPRASGAELRAEGHTTTNAKGRFSSRLRSGPSRDVHFVHRVDGGSVSDSLAVKVRAPVRLRSSRRSLRNGDVLTLHGSLRAGPFPKRGVLVELQARRGSKWQTFGKVTRTNRKGRYRLRYRFTRTLGVQRYLLRARVPRQPAYPFSSGASRPVSVKVSG